ncbi:MAG: hypothetical protein LBS55_03775 [Prevotellaceae bacterium]|nr:hypothetical protein [Prevotellaceae bacterium]
MFSQFDKVLKKQKTGFSTMSTGCGRPSGTFRQCQRVADDHRERFDNVNGLRTTIGNVLTMSTDCGQPSGTF